MLTTKINNFLFQGIRTASIISLGLILLRLMILKETFFDVFYLLLIISLFVSYTFYDFKHWIYKVLLYLSLLVVLILNSYAVGSSTFLDDNLATFIYIVVFVICIYRIGLLLFPKLSKYKIYAVKKDLNESLQFIYHKIICTVVRCINLLFNKYEVWIVCLFLLISSFVLRVKAVQISHPFWIDEFSTAVQARYYLQYGINTFSQTQTFIEPNNVLTHAVVALAFKFIAQTESVARMPMVFVGILVPAGVYLLVRNIFDRKTALIAGLFTATSYFQIAWSTQARGYIFQQFLSILLLWLYFKPKKTFLTYTLLLLISFLGVLTHKLFIFFIVVLFIDQLLTFVRNIRSIKLNKIFILLLPILSILTFLILKYTSLIPEIADSIFSDQLFRLNNNLWYYHSLLWRHNQLLVFLAVIGFIYALKKSWRTSIILFSILSMQLGFVTFIFGHYQSKYIFPVYYILIIFGAYGLVSLVQQIYLVIPNFKSLKKYLTPMIFTTLCGALLIANGDKFVTKPQAFYSIDHEMRDIAIVDYHEAYRRIQDHINTSSEPVAMIDTWTDRAKWYLGNNYPHLYLLRWENDGIHRSTDFTINENKDKVVNNTKDNPIILVSSGSDLKKVMKQYKSGYLWIDDASMPKDVIEFALLNLWREIHLEHYDLDDNPFSIWPANLYSWGIHDPNPYFPRKKAIK